MTKWDIAIGVWLGISMHELVRDITKTLIEFISRRTR